MHFLTRTSILLLNKHMNYLLIKSSIICSTIENDNGNHMYINQEI